MYVIIAYDSPSNRRRTKLMNLLKDHIAHVQESVFEGPLDGPTLNRLLERITDLVDPKSDSVRVYRMPVESWNKTEVIGLPPLTRPRPVIVVSSQQDGVRLEDLSGYGDEPF
ncbi:MAG: CRISPR-associated endonuclease Cas2 [Candidatus Riflebacteria bacterium]|nr:CRISPR-associated endonuclease Cas2 [Candidatus Riflebacteria bacterium]